MTDIVLPYMDTVTVINTIRDFINNSYASVSGSPIVDPLSDSGRSRGSGTGLAVYEDETLIISQFPKITIEAIDLPRDRMAGGKSIYRERFRHQIAIVYTCSNKHTWVRNSTSYVGKQQCIRYLQYLGDQLKLYSGSFPEFNEMVIGAISPPASGVQAHTYQSFLTLKIDTFGRTGA